MLVEHPFRTIAGKHSAMRLYPARHFPTIKSSQKLVPRLGRIIPLSGCRKFDLNCANDKWHACVVFYVFSDVSDIARCSPKLPEDIPYSKSEKERLN